MTTTCSHRHRTRHRRALAVVGLSVAGITVVTGCGSSGEAAPPTTKSETELAIMRNDGALTFDEWNADTDHRLAIGTGFYAAQQLMGILCEEISGSISRQNAHDVILQVAAEGGEVRPAQAEGLLWFAWNAACYDQWMALPESV